MSAFILVSIVILLFGVLVGGVISYNRLIRQVNQRKEAWSAVEVQLKRRHDLVPQLVEAVKAYLDHEQQLFTAVGVRRAEAISACDSTGSAGEAEQCLTADLGRILMLAEAYPELKSNRSFLQLGRSLIEIEETLQYARRYYNGSTRDLNNLIETFPSLIVARLFGFKSETFFKLNSTIESISPNLGNLFNNHDKRPCML